MSRKPAPSNVTVRVEIDGMTWNDLRQFVHLCRNVPGDIEVGGYANPDGGWQAGLEESVPIEGGI